MVRKTEYLTGRQEYIDVFRAFGIILMVMGHIGFGDLFDHFIHAFHMPMFFVISGFFFKHMSEDTISSFMKKKINSLLIPYFSFGLIHYLLYLLISKKMSIEPLLHLLWVNTEGLPIAGALWFLTALFFTNIIYFLIDRYITNAVYKGIVVAVIAVGGNLAKIILPFNLPYALGASMVGIGLFHIGYMLHEKESKKEIHKLLNMGWLEWSISAAIVTVLIFINGDVNMRAGDYAFIPLFWINSVGAVIVGMNFSRWILAYIQDIFICKWLCDIGRNSIVYVCLNQIVIWILYQISMRLSVPIALANVLILILSLFALALCSWVFKKSKLKWLKY